MKKNVIRLITAVFLVLAGIGEMFLLKQYPQVCFPAYRNFSRKWISLLSWIFSIVPCSVWDVGAAVLVLLVLFCFIRTLRQKKPLFRFVTTVLLVMAVLLWSALQGWLGNHYAPKLSTYLDLEVRQYSVEELYEATEYYFLHAAEYAPLVPRDTYGHVQINNLYTLAAQAGASYQPLSIQYDVFQGSTRPVKIFSFIGEYLLYNGIVGMFMPITGEASVPRNVPAVPMPFTMCHEAAHRLGIASEKEANFCAFLACSASDNPLFCYSGYYEAFGYCFNALYSADHDKAMELYDAYNENTGVQLLKLDRYDTYTAYQKYESPLQDISDEINDTYLKTFSQESGIRSYGEVTDYLIAWYVTGRVPE